MNLTLEKLKSLWKQKDSIFSAKSDLDLSERFDEINRIIDEFIKIDIGKYSSRIKKFTSDNEGILTNNPKVCYYNMLNQVNKDEDDYKHIQDCWKLIAGYKDENPVDEFRIISNNFTKPDYHGKLVSYGDRSVRVNGNFASNNYFFQIAKFLQECQMPQNPNFNELIDKSKIVLSWYGVKDLGGRSVGIDEAFKKSMELLERRFPVKFLWMWASKLSVLHLLSLSSFQNFLDTDYGKRILKNLDDNWSPGSITNSKFDEFTGIWKQISKKIIQDITGSTLTPDSETIRDLSKLLSLISIDEADLKNIQELLQIGNKAVILWGPPGTGKTYESLQVVKKMLAPTIDIKNFEDDYLFSKNENNLVHDHGYYEIVQFHPNYTYEDFIGGIQPSLSKEKKLSYELKHGIFKRFCDKAKDKDEPYILIIDEINRAELSAVFGELLFALEYRDKPINLPHFGEFSIPDNVYLIGTMNNVDKSLVTFDLALRRRFGFFKLNPKLETLAIMPELDFLNFENRQRFIIRSQELNKNVVKHLRLEDDCQIGQAYFKKIIDFVNEYEEDTISRFALEKLWEYHLYPLLEEYLGMSIDDDTIHKQLKTLKESFIKDLENP